MVRVNTYSFDYSLLIDRARAFASTPGRGVQSVSILFFYDRPHPTDDLTVINSGSELTLPIRVTFELVKRLQLNVAPNVFSPRGVYDGRKNLFTARALSFGDSAEVRDHCSFCMRLSFDCVEPSVRCFALRCAIPWNATGGTTPTSWSKVLQNSPHPCRRD